MLEKIERVLDLLIRVLSRELEKEGHITEDELEVKPIPVKRGRKPKQEVGAGVIPTAASDVFAVKASPEDVLEASRRCIEVMGAFIKKNLNAKPLNGQQKAKQIMQDELGRPIGKLGDLSYEDHLKLIPRFELELDS